MCRKVTHKFECGHNNGPSVMNPDNPADCPEAVKANRRHKKTNRLLQCKSPPTSVVNTGGYCQKPNCFVWYLQEFGWSCCACKRQNEGGSWEVCHCSHTICKGCSSVINQEQNRHPQGHGNCYQQQGYSSEYESFSQLGYNQDAYDQGGYGQERYGQANEGHD
ncbi:uncharacterized protein PgNI_01470 [Pyricularia grisea]|uniref:Uncharacterized protein n=1 Tax=Pyricularia grisea TaxID=148305 RepID=A0A6P8BG80_PYRGI|nr:uncharacterized protein PgNI_01470 [Pyricularia grisea]TLD15871.1 hypothetical protein PgNI_01470 [Pyricularia grisea]